MHSTCLRSSAATRWRSVGATGGFVAGGLSWIAEAGHREQMQLVFDQFSTELSTGRMDPRVGSGRVGSRFCRIWVGRVGSGQHFGFLNFLLIISWYLNRYESSDTAFGLIDILRYLMYDN